MNADATAALAGGDSHADESHDDDGYGIDESLVEFDLCGLDGAGSSHLLTLDVAEYAVEHDTDFGSYEIRELLDEEDE